MLLDRYHGRAVADVLSLRVFSFAALRLRIPFFFESCAGAPSRLQATASILLRTGSKPA
jgi:hypothetical protein